MGKMFGIWYFFYLKRQGYVEKDHIIFIHKSYNDRFDNWHMLHTYICLLLLVYAWFWTCISLHLCSFFPYDLLKFSGCYLSTSEWVTVLNLTAIYLLFNLFIQPCKRRTLYCLCMFKETLVFNFLWKLFNKYFSLPWRTCQFRVSVRKWAKIVKHICHFYHFIIKLWKSCTCAKI